MGKLILIHFTYTPFKTKVQYIAHYWKPHYHWCLSPNQLETRLENTQWYVINLYNSDLLKYFIS